MSAPIFQQPLVTRRFAYAGRRLRPNGFWAYLADKPDAGSIFNSAMKGKAHGQVAAIVVAYDFAQFKRIGDIGGGSFKELKKEGINTELMQLGGSDIKPCMACFKCFENKNRRCVREDQLNVFIKKMIEADGIIIGSPTYSQQCLS